MSEEKRYTLRMDAELFDHIKQRAEKNSRSVAKEMEAIFRREEETYHDVPERFKRLHQSLEGTCNYINSVSDEENKEKLINSLNVIIRFYGEMILKSWEFKWETVSNSYDYEVFLLHYKRVQEAIISHKTLLENAIALEIDDIEKREELFKLYKKFSSPE